MKLYHSKTGFIVQGAIIAALYVVITWLGAPLASGVIQVRFSEALTILPCFTASAVPGVTIGCLIANLLNGNAPWDVILGTTATLIGAVGTRFLRKKPYFTPIFPIAANTLIVPFVLAYVYHKEGTVPFFMLTVGIGEVVSAGILGCLLYAALQKYGKTIPWWTRS